MNVLRKFIKYKRFLHICFFFRIKPGGGSRDEWRGKSFATVNRPLDKTDENKRDLTKKMCEIIKQGAEAKLYVESFNGNPCLVKERFVKNYRLPELDKTLTKSRIKAEQKTTKRCEDAGIRVPKLFNVDYNEKKVYMEYFDKAITAKDFIVQIVQKNDSDVELEKLCKRIGIAGWLNKFILLTSHSPENCKIKNKQRFTTLTGIFLKIICSW